MDLHPIPDADAAPEERAAVDSILGPPESGWEGAPRRVDTEDHVGFGGHAARERRHLLLPVLWAVQSRAGWISRGALNYVCRRLSVPPADAYGVATFYSMLSVEPQPKTIVHVCDDLACRLAGGPALLDALKSRLPAGSVRPSPCLGLCERSPAVLFQCAGEGAKDYVVAPASLESVRPPLTVPLFRRGEPSRTPSPPERGRGLG